MRPEHTFSRMASVGDAVYGRSSPPDRGPALRLVRGSRTSASFLGGPQAVTETDLFGGLDWTLGVLRGCSRTEPRASRNTTDCRHGPARPGASWKNRPDGAGHNLMTLHAPFRRLSAGALYLMTHSLMERFEL